MMESVALTDSAMIVEDDFIVVSSSGSNHTPPGSAAARELSRLNLGHEGDIDDDDDFFDESEDEDDDSYDMLSRCDDDAGNNESGRNPCCHPPPHRLSLSHSSSCSLLVDEDESDFAAAAVAVVHNDEVMTTVDSRNKTNSTVEASLRAVRSLVTTTLESARVQVYGTRPVRETLVGASDVLAETIGPESMAPNLVGGATVGTEMMVMEESEDRGGFDPNHDDGTPDDEGSTTDTSASLRSAPNLGGGVGGTVEEDDSKASSPFEGTRMTMSDGAAAAGKTGGIMRSGGSSTPPAPLAWHSLDGRMKGRKKGRRRVKLLKKVNAVAATASSLSELRHPAVTPSPAGPILEGRTIYHAPLPTPPSNPHEVPLESDHSAKVVVDAVAVACTAAAAAVTTDDDDDDSDEEECPPFATEDADALSSKNADALQGQGMVTLV